MSFVLSDYPLLKHGSVTTWVDSADPAKSARGWEKLLDRCTTPEQKDFFTQLAGGAAECMAKRLVEVLFAYSPYLSALVWHNPQFVMSLLQADLDQFYAGWQSSLTIDSLALTGSAGQAELMRLLRQHKAEGALLIALADLTALWTLEQTTQALTALAERSIQHTLGYLLDAARQRNELQYESIEQCGIIVLGMGKLGGYELNYSSDIDLVLLYEPEKLSYTGRHSLQHCLNRIAQDLASILQERTPDGYVFRTDLRLRPDPASTPPIMSVDSALRYYESVGQNWERAAFIKARPVAGDMAAGDDFLKQLKPFIWRKNLDFAAIADIHSLKRQMDARDPASIDPAGHNIKTGAGGIREIEFTAQILQLIWGGKKSELRGRSTCSVLITLRDMQLITRQECETMTTLYRELRRIEHRLQMVNDQQTHTLPKAEDERSLIAHFSGYDTVNAFDRTVKKMLMQVHAIYSESFDNSPSLALGGNLSFTGVDFDPSTLETISALGFKRPEEVAGHIQQWHRGTIRATRTSKARELLTELTPALLKAFGDTTDPDHAFAIFAKFMAALPAGVQLLSQFNQNPEVITAIVSIMSDAPGLAEQLSRHPDWLDVILAAKHQDVLASPPDPEQYLSLSHHPDDAIRWLCRYRNEWEFLVGVEVLRGKLTASEISAPLTAIADASLQRLVAMTTQRFEEDYGTIEGGSLAVIALGRLGSRELIFGSDLDLIFAYDLPDSEAVSNGKRSFPASVYYTRLCQRIVNQLEALTPEGKLYDIDTRLRPGGKDQMLAISLDSFERYYATNAWTFEKMALLKARFIAGDTPLGERIEKALRHILSTTAENPAIRQDIADMRQRIAREFGWQDHWNPKYARGGLMDITFIAQYLALQNAAQKPQYLHHKSTEILDIAEKDGTISAADAAILKRGWVLQEQLLCLLRLCQQNFNEATASEGLKNFLIRCLHSPDFAALKGELISLQNDIYALFTRLIGNYLSEGEPS